MSHQQRAHILRWVLENELSTFYKDFYTNTDAPASFLAGESNAWKEIPFMTREVIQKTPWKDRLYIPLQDVGVIRSTSGTTGKGVMIIPRTYIEPEYSASLRNWYNIGEYKGTRGAVYGATACWNADVMYKEYGLNSIILDQGDMETSVALCRAYIPEHLIGYGYVLHPLGERLRGTEAAAAVKVVRVFGERSSTLQWEMLHENFPHAVIISEYVSIEMQRTGAISCEFSSKEHTQYVHPIPEDAHIEVLDPKTGEDVGDIGAVGEVVITMLRTTSMPLIRYRTGDAARIIRTSCPCGSGSPLLALEGRLDTDHIRISGGEINLAEVDRVVAEHKEYLTGDDFELTYTEEKERDGNVKPRVTLGVQWDSAQFEAETLANSIAKHLRVAPTRTYAEGVSKGMYKPLVVQQLSKPTSLGKRKRMVKNVV